MRAVALGLMLFAEAAFAQSSAVDDLLRTGRFVEAEIRLRETVRSHPTAEVKAALAIALSGQFRFGDAEPLIADACQRNPRKDSWWFILAKCQFERGQSLLAMKSLDTALKIHESPDLLEARAACSLQGGDPTTAEGFLRRALAIDPDHGGSLLRLAGILIDRGQYVEASPLVLKSTVLRSDSAEAWFLHCLCERRQGRHHEALLAADRVISFIPSHTGAIQQRIGLLRLLQRKDEARVAIESLKTIILEDDAVTAAVNGMRLAPTDCEQRKAIALRAMKLGRHDIALEQLRAVAALAPSDPGLPPLLAELDRRRGGSASRLSGAKR